MKGSANSTNKTNDNLHDTDIKSATSTETSSTDISQTTATAPNELESEAQIARKVNEV